MEATVSQQFCDERSGNIKNTVEKLNVEVTDLKEIVARLTYLVEAHEKKISREDITSNKINFWQTKAFEWMIKTACIIITLLTMAAIGMNYFKEYLTKIAG